MCFHWLPKVYHSTPSMPTILCIFSYAELECSDMAVSVLLLNDGLIAKLIKYWIIKNSAAHC